MIRNISLGIAMNETIGETSAHDVSMFFHTTSFFFSLLVSGKVCA